MVSNLSNWNFTWVNQTTDEVAPNTSPVSSNLGTADNPIFVSSLRSSIWTT